MDEPDLRSRMASLVGLVSDGGAKSEYINLQPWWRDAQILSGIGRLLAEPFQESGVTVVVGPPSNGYLLGALVAAHFGVGFAALRKDPEVVVDSDPWVLATTAPDYQDRHLTLGVRKGIIHSRDRVLAIDDVVDTGSQLLATQRLVHNAGASWVGASVALDLLESSATRRQLGLSAIFRGRELGR